MALFGEEMTDVVTPDGRRMRLPAQLAAQFPALQPPPAEPQLPDPGIGAAPGAPAPQPTAPPTPQLQPGELGPPPTSEPAPAPEQSPPPQQPAASAAPAPLPAAPAQPQPVTNAQLAKDGAAGAFNRESAALDQRAAAVQQQAEVEANEATEIGKKSEEIAAKTDEILINRQKQVEANAAALNARMADYDRRSKEIADTKIDRKASHPILAAISVALGGIGAALAGKPGENPALDALYKAIDRKVAGQMQDLDAKRGALGADRDRLGLERQAGQDRLAEMDQYRMAYLDNAKRDIEAVKAKSGSARVRAAADLALAGLEGERAKTYGEAAAREQARIEREQQRKDQKSQFYAGLGQNERHFQARLAEDKRQFDTNQYNDLLKAKMAADAKGKGKSFAEKEDENRKFAVGDPSSGEWLLQPEAAPLLKQATALEGEAKKFEAAAEAEKDPAKREQAIATAKAYTQKAAEVRGEARNEYAFKVGDTGERQKLADQIASSQNIAGAVQRVKELRSKHGPRWIRTTEGEAAMQAMGVNITMAFKDAWQLGVLSKQDVDLLDKATGGDPSKLTLGDIANFLGAEGPASRLDELVQGLEENVKTKLRSRQFRGEFKLQRGKDASLSPTQKATDEAFKADKLTPAEAGNDRPGVAGQVLDTVRPSNFANALYGGETDPQRRRAIEADAAGSERYPGLNQEQAAAVDLNLRAYQQNAGSANPKAQERAKLAADTLLRLATAPTDEAGRVRASVSSGVLAALEQRAPDLHKQALAQLPKEVAAERSQSEQVVMSVQPIGLLTQTAIAGDKQARSEILRRIAQGDRDAQRAAQEIMMAAGRPAGAASAQGAR